MIDDAPSLDRTHRVVGCTTCDGLWLIEHFPRIETATCPQCGTTHDRDQLRSLAWGESREDAAENRARILAERAGERERYRAEGDYGDQAARVEDRLDQPAAFASAVDERLDAFYARAGPDAWPDVEIADVDLADQVSDKPIGTDVFADEVEERLEADPRTEWFDTAAERYLERRDEPTADEIETERTCPPDASLALVGPFQAEPDLGRDALVDAGPRASEWVPEVLDPLLDVAIDAVETLARRTDPGLLDGRGLTAFAGTLHDWGVTALSGDFAQAIVQLALQDDVDDEVRAQLRQLGTGRGPRNAGIDAIRDGVIALLQLAEPEDYPTPSLTIRLPGDEWVGADVDARTRERALEVIATVASVAQVEVVASPAVEDLLSARHHEWLENLNERRMGPDEQVDAGAVEEADAWNALEDESIKAGHRQILLNLPEGGERTQAALKRDDDVGLAAGSIDRYCAELEAAGLVEREDRGRNVVVYMTPEGQAAQGLIAADGTATHPDQTELDTLLTPTPQVSTSTVCGATGGKGDGSAPGDAVAEGVATVDGAIAAQAGADGPGAQWLPGVPDDEAMSPWAVQERYRAAVHEDACTLVDAPVVEFDDGRAPYLSNAGDEDQVTAVVEWGGSDCTLARVTEALLADLSWNKILDVDRLNTDLSALLPDRVEYALEAFLRRGIQQGWVGEEEIADYDSLRDRFETVKTVLLERLKQKRQSGDPDAEYYKRIHGLLASTTQLYRAAGLEVDVITLIPDTHSLLGQDNLRRDFLEFVQHTLPKHAVYDDADGVSHSVYRQLVEDREEKLKRRLPVNLDVEDPDAELTVNWSFVGPDMTSVLDDVRSALDSVEVRDRVATGEETTCQLSIPVRDGTSYASIRDVVERFVTTKQYSSAPIRRMTRFVMSVLGDGRSANPMHVAEAFLRISSADRPGATLSIEDLEAGIAELPAIAVMPHLQDRSRSGPTVSRSGITLLQELLAADRPLGRSELIDLAGISGSTYDRQLPKLREALEGLGILSRDERKWTATLVPYWSDATESASSTDEQAILETDHWDGVLFEIAVQHGVEFDYKLFEKPVSGSNKEWQDWVDRLLDELEDLIPWLQFVLAHVDTELDLLVDERSSRWTVQYGNPPTASDPDQMPLSPAAAD